MTLERWKSGRGKVTEARMRARLEKEGYQVARCVYPPGTFLPDHTHPFEKKDTVVSGQFLIKMHGQEFVLGPGDGIRVPPGAKHSAEVMGTEPVVSLDASKTLLPPLPPLPSKAR